MNLNIGEYETQKIVQMITFDISEKLKLQY